MKAINTLRKPWLFNNFVETHDLTNLHRSSSGPSQTVGECAACADKDYLTLCAGEAYGRDAVLICVLCQDCAEDLPELHPKELLTLALKEEE